MYIVKTIGKYARDEYAAKAANIEPYMVRFVDADSTEWSQRQHDAKLFSDYADFEFQATANFGNKAGFTDWWQWLQHEYGARLVRLVPRSKP